MFWLGLFIGAALGVFIIGLCLAASNNNKRSLTAAANGTRYVAHVYARRTVDSKDRVFNPGQPLSFVLLPAPA